ncbi:EF-P beta-lysylation protein EpmB [Stenotrophobium rhamnosiphilum]|uniref:L-lysine 2,3-aminomutase n=1 Tax=Stenotrophobium rhamnosiphilum TaxID=2029166 RepID=A0A2T5ME17_9GAMM|nr:EF-P beta-lysylation protein EpmB [Stenotrophobium rhamnosiphilum]PTU30831.1 EF-P beta-lysylation protein EpmB [Stenotrophobium rhamnosiphilum]
MIPKPTFSRQQAPLWQHELRKAFARPADLLEFLQLDPALPALQLERLRDFPLRVPHGFAGRMKKGDASDPLFLQVWPQAREAEDTPGFSQDAVGDLHKLKPGGLIHKYEGRALVVATGACAINCRYCFRRHFPYSDAIAARGHWQETLRQLQSDPSIEEVILSGGDPLSLSDDKLAELVTALDALPQLRRLRIHTRQPVVLPERVDDHLLSWISGTRLKVAVVIHANHANELDSSVAAALERLRDAGATLLNQAVLLKGVNDSVSALEDLSKKLFDCGVLPYYLHMLDRVAGAAHFEIPLEEATALMQALSSRLSGYLVPRLVREDAGAPSKTLLPW